MDERIFKVEGNILYPDKTMLTWGPFYYHSREKAIERMDGIMKDVVDWCNLKPIDMNIEPENVVKTNLSDQIGFKINAWTDDMSLVKCTVFISVEDIFFED